MKQQYLGDGVYLVTNERFMGDIRLTTGTHEVDKDANNTIYLNRTMLADAITLFDEDTSDLMTEIQNKKVDCKHCE